MLNGEIWKHRSGDYCNFYGVQYGCQIVIPFNQEPVSVKNYWNITQQSRSIWSSSLIDIPPSASYPSGMKSELIAGKWGLYEGQYKADFLRDYEDPSQKFSGIAPPLLKKTTALLQGRPLRGEVMIVTMDLESQENYSNLQSVTVYYTKSSQTL